MLAGVANSYDTPSFLLVTFLSLPLLSFFKAFQITTEIHSSNSPIPNMLKHSAYPSFP
jgi:hypothetical protein